MQKGPVRIVTTLLLLFTISASGQKLVNSPYSRFNLGTLEPASPFRSIGMGGAGTGFRDNSSIYFSNPASYSSLDTTSFVFDFGLDYGLNTLKTAGSQHTSDDINFDHLIMGFPLSKGWGFALGVVNLTNGYYNITQDVTEGDPDYDPIAGAYTSDHFGSGGYSSFFMGTGLNLTKNISVGSNINVLFGNVQRTNDFQFADYYNMFHYSNAEHLQLSGVNFDLGAQYNAKFKNKFFFVAGASYSLGKNYKTQYESISYRYTAYGSDDTISYVSDDQIKTFIPATVRVGISFGKKDKFVAGIDYVATKWSTAEIPGQAGYLGDTRNILFGAEYIPDKLANYGFLRRLEYRAGAHTGDNYLVLNGTQVKEYGASLGIGIPMRRTLSKTNLFVDLTKKYAPGTAYHSETYFTFGASLNLYDWWFIKRKYD